MFEHNQIPNFEQDVLPHLDAAYNLARWLTRNEQDAQDVAQEAYLRAFRFFPGFRGGDARAWLLKIVRNTFYTWSHGTGRCKTPPNLTRNFSLQILMFSIQKKLPSKTTATLWSEKRWRCFRRPPAKSSFCANSRGCPTRDCRYHGHAYRHRDVELVACARPPSSSSGNSYE